MSRAPAFRAPSLLLAALIPLVATGTALAAWVPFAPDAPQSVPRVGLVSAGPGGVTLEVDVPGVTTEPVALGGASYVRLSLPDARHTIDTGLPELPELRTLLAIPQGARVVVSVVSREDVVLDDMIVAPCQPPTTDADGAGPAPAAVRDESFYRGTATYPGTPVVADDPVVWRDLAVAPLRIRPFRYDAAERRVIASKRLRIDVRFDGGSGFEPLTGAVSPAWARRYRAAVLNYESLGFPVIHATTPGRDLIILAADALADSVQPLAAWHRREGTGTEVVRLSTVGTTKEQVKAWLTSRYNADHMSAVLLVGDISLLPIGIVATSIDANTPSDHWYACLGGSGDYLPEFDIARLSSTTGGGIAHQVRKILTYEVTPPADEWFTRSLLAANERSDYIACKQQIASQAYHGEPAPTFETCYAGMGGTRAQLVAAIERGLNLLNYRGHGLQASWYWAVGWTVNDIRALQNGEHYCLVFNICCENAWLDYAGETIAEAWLAADHAAAGALGASRDSYTDPNHTFDKELYKAVFDSSFCGTMEAVNYAKMRVSGDYLGRDNNWMYLWLGDPVMRIWTRQPSTLAVTHPELAWPLMDDFRVDVTAGSAPLAGARVCLRTRSGEVYLVETTGADGRATFQLGDFAVPDSMDVTVTAHNARPYLGTIATGFTGPALVCTGETLDDDAAGASLGDGDGFLDAGERVELGVTLRNIGSETACGCCVTLETSSPFLSVVDAGEELGDIASLETREAPGAFVIDVAPGAPDGATALLTMTMHAGAEAWSEEIQYVVHAPVVTVEAWRVIDTPGGDGDGMAEPGEEVALEATLRNAGSADVHAIVARLTSTTGLALVPADSAGAAVLGPGGSLVLAPAFRVIVAPDAPVPSSAPLTLEVNGAWRFAAGGEAPLAVGPLREDVEHGAGLWTHALVTPGFVDQWARTTLENHTPGGRWAWKFGNAITERYADRSDGALMTPVVPLGPSSRLVFWYQIQAETSATPGVARDGGVIEVSVEGGAWHQVTPEGGYPFVTEIGVAPSPFPAGTPCFSGMRSWTRAVADLSAFQGNARIRFRFGSDGAVGYDGWSVDDFEITGPAATDVVPGATAGGVAAALRLDASRPNPVRAGASIEYSLPRDGAMELAVFDVSGRMVATIERGIRAAGAHAVTWDGRDARGRRVMPGIYFYRLRSGAETLTRSMVVLP